MFIYFKSVCPRPEVNIYWLSTYSRIHHLDIQQQETTNGSREIIFVFLEIKLGFSAKIKHENVRKIEIPRWAEYGEENSKYFLNLEKRNYNSKYIKKVIKTNGTEISEPSQILQEQLEFYTNFYKSRFSGQPNFDVLDTFLSNKNIPKLNEVDKQKCDDGLTLEDLTDAINNMALDKSPGADGFTKNFYKYFWNELKQPLLDSYIFSFEHGQ